MLVGRRLRRAAATLRLFLYFVPIYLLVTALTQRPIRTGPPAQVIAWKAMSPRALLTNGVSVWEIAQDMGRRTRVAAPNQLDAKSVADFARGIQQRPYVDNATTPDLRRVQTSILAKLPPNDTLAINLVENQRPLVPGRPTIFLTTVVSGKRWLERRLFLRRLLSNVATGVLTAGPALWPETRRDVLAPAPHTDAKPAGAQLVWILVEAGERLSADSLHFLNCSGVPFVYFAYDGASVHSSDNAALQMVDALATKGLAGPVVDVDMRSMVDTRIFGDLAASESKRRLGPHVPQIYAWPVHGASSGGIDRVLRVSETGALVWSGADPHSELGGVPRQAFAFDSTLLAKLPAERRRAGQLLPDRAERLCAVLADAAGGSSAVTPLAGGSSDAARVFWRNGISDKSFFLSCPGEQSLDRNNELLIDAVPWFENATRAAELTAAGVQRRPTWYTENWTYPHRAPRRPADSSAKNH